MNNLNKISFVFIIVFGISAVAYFSLTNSWLEQQRVAEILLILSVPFVYFVKEKYCFLSNKLNIAVIAIFWVGCISSLLSEYPVWAFKEWAKTVGLFFVALGIASSSRNEKFTDYLMGVILCISFLLSFEFLNFYIAALLSENKNIDPYLLYPGFDNPRFYAQAVILFMPFTAWLASRDYPEKYKWVLRAAQATTILQWMIIIALAGRGSWVAAAVANGIIFIFIKNSRIYIKKQIIFFSLGFLLYILLFHWVPVLLSIENTSLPSGLRSGLSAREKIWGIAWRMGAENPWLGKGPLHFSSQWNHIGAHPHQVILQWFAEWGGLATGILILIAAIGFLKGLKFIRNSQRSTPLDMAIWIALMSGVILGQVDGVFVMPYSEMWFAIVAGLGVGRWSEGYSESIFIKYTHILLTSCAVVILLCVLIFDVPYLYTSQVGFWEFYKIGSPPRFWDQGWIPMEYK